ncbi:hypothetical protein [Ancylobacter polymorphus]|uniref:Lipoprotein n=1 Tax=Ancylobacter polymorphus TaxID=223390 RepID=A0ABU0BHJ7_9HYPH|nr:hypothetical protein [Ancylobacter polymorphus]MDQ0305315.1 hypothetical protein [Ancylobacter polymorphus]
MRLAFPIVLTGLALAGCSTTPTDLEQKTAPTVLEFKENYQEIYRRVAKQATRCLKVDVGEGGSFEVDTELYNELGYGEVTYSHGSLARNYYMSAKIEKVGEGSRLTVYSGNQLAPARVRDLVVEWANGSTACPAF